MNSLSQTTQLCISPKELAEIVSHRLLSRNLDNADRISVEPADGGLMLSCVTDMAFAKEKFYNPIIFLSVALTETGCCVSIQDVYNYWSPSRTVCFWLFTFFLIAKIIYWISAPSMQSAGEILMPALLLLLTSLATGDRITKESRRREKILRSFVLECINSV
jgi:hypothetical protein